MIFKTIIRDVKLYYQDQFEEYLQGRLGLEQREGLSMNEAFDLLSKMIT